MSFHPERYIRPSFLILACAVIAPSAANWLRTASHLPAGYGAEGDRRRASPIPALVRPAVEDLSAGSEGSWVKEGVAGEAWVYDLHLCRGGKESVIRLTAHGNVIPPNAPDSEPEPPHAVETGG